MAAFEEAAARLEEEFPAQAPGAVLRCLLGCLHEARADGVDGGDLLDEAVVSARRLLVARTPPDTLTRRALERARIMNRAAPRRRTVFRWRGGGRSNSRGE